jgi:hypothetical protein
LLEELLENTVSVFVILDRDYRSDAQITQVEQRLRAIGVFPHVWQRKELESYFLVPSAIARRSGATEDDVRDELLRLASTKKEHVFARILAERHATEVTAHRHQTTVTERVQADFDQQWSGPFKRVFLCDAKDLLAGVNRWLQAEGRKTVSARTLSTTLRTNEIADEMELVISRIERLDVR